MGYLENWGIEGGRDPIHLFCNLPISTGVGYSENWGRGGRDPIHLFCNLPISTGVGYSENWGRGGRDPIHLSWGGTLRELGERGVGTQYIYSATCQYVLGWDTQRTGGEGVGTGVGQSENWGRGGQGPNTSILQPVNTYWGGILRELGERG